MRDDVIHRLGYGALAAVKSNTRFPFKWGNLKHNATYVSFSKKNSFTIVFDKEKAPYIDALEEGKKHNGFIKIRATDDVIIYLSTQFRAKVIDRRYELVNTFGRRYNSDD